MNILYGVLATIFILVPGTIVVPLAAALLAYPFLPKNAKEAIREIVRNAWMALRDRLRRFVAEVRPREMRVVNTGRHRFRKIMLGVKDEPKDDPSQAVTEKMPLPRFHSVTLRYRIGFRRRRVPLKVPVRVLVRA